MTDILTRSAEFIWDDVLGTLPPVLAMFFLRWGLLLSFLSFIGAIVRFLLSGSFWHTLHLQLAGIVIAGCLTFAIPLNGIAASTGVERKSLLLASLVAFLMIPYFLPSVLVRRRGVQDILRRFLYGAEFALLGLQLFVFDWR